MTREVDLAAYLPPFMQAYKELTAALDAENPEFRLVWDAAGRALYNHFISTADEYGISRFEKMLGIYPGGTDSLESRRKRVQSRWFNSVPYSIRVLEAKLAELLGEHNFSIDGDFSAGYEMQLVIYSTDESRTEEVRHILAATVPLSIAADLVYESVTSGMQLCFGGCLEQADILELKQR